MVALNKSVQLISLQFAFSNTNIFPPWACWAIRDEKWNRWKERKYHEGTGEIVISPVQNCSLKEFVGELERAGYKIADALCQLRPDQKDDTRKRKYCMARFIFVREEHLEELSPEFKNALEKNRDFIQKMCEEANWRVRVFRNPFFRNGEQIPDQSAVSINLEARNPLIQPNGQPVLVWQKDGQGNRIGDMPLPLKPDHYLHIKDGAIQLI